MINGSSNNRWSYQNPKTNQLTEYYLAGNKFTQLIIFMGCAPKVNINPEINRIQTVKSSQAVNSYPELNKAKLDANFVAIKFSPIRKPAQLYPGKVPFSLRCSACKNNTVIEDYEISTFTCSSCNKESNYTITNFRHKAAYSQCFIEVMGIYESEAIPSDVLMDHLEKTTNTKWSYFYANESSVDF